MFAFSSPSLTHTLVQGTINDFLSLLFSPGFVAFQTFQPGTKVSLNRTNH